MSDSLHISERVNDLQKQRDASLGKMYEVMALISAGSFAVLVSFSPTDKSFLTQIALSLFIVCMLSCIESFHCEAKSSGKMMLKLIQNPNITHSMAPTKFSKFASRASWISLMLAFLLLLLNDIVTPPIESLL